MQKFKEFVLQYNKDVAPHIDNFFQKEMEEAGKIDELLPKLLSDYKDFLNGGKKLRGSLIALGYELYGGKNKELALLASTLIEITHTFFLIHDDIMDRDSLRRGVSTMHIKYGKEFGEHFGIAKAIDLGDIGIFLSYKVLSQLDTSPEIKTKLQTFINQAFLEVGYGQMLDIVYEKEKRLNEESVLKIHRHKTADYTISAPLSMGAILAGCTESDLRSIKDFGIPVGIGFQLRDDELGMFSSEEELGKPVDSDLKEGKMTLLITKVLELAKGDDLEFIKGAYGKNDLKPNEIERAREIITSSGALEFSKKRSREFVEQGKKFIPRLTKDKKYQELLNELADFVIQREK